MPENNNSKNDAILLDIKEKVSELIQKYHYDFNQQDDADCFVEAERESYFRERSRRQQ